MLRNVLTVSIAVGLAFNLWACTSCDSKSDAESIAQALADRLVDALEFENGTKKDGPAPEGSPDGPAIEDPQWPDEDGFKLGEDFTFTFKVSYSGDMGEVTKTIVAVEKDGVPATKHIVVRHEIDTGTRKVTLRGRLKEDSKLADEAFRLKFALQTEGGVTGFYVSWNVVVKPGGPGLRSDARGAPGVFGAARLTSEGRPLA